MLPEISLRAASARVKMGRSSTGADDMKKVLALTATAVAMVLVGCGSETKSCSTTDAQLAVSGGPPVARCAVAPGQTVTIPVRLCANCAQSSPSCPGSEWRVTNLGTFVDINPVLRECEEDRGCAIGGSCDLNPSTNCAVAIPANASPGTYPVVYKGEDVGEIVVGASAGCTFAFAGGGELNP
jgi:hypothetical protein